MVPVVLEGGGLHLVRRAAQGLGVGRHDLDAGGQGRRGRCEVGARELDTHAPEAPDALEARRLEGAHEGGVCREAPAAQMPLGDLGHGGAMRRGGSLPVRDQGGGEVVARRVDVDVDPGLAGSGVVLDPREAGERVAVVDEHGGLAVDHGPEEHLRHFVGGAVDLPEHLGLAGAHDRESSSLVGRVRDGDGAAVEEAHRAGREPGRQVRHGVGSSHVVSLTEACRLCRTDFTPAPTAGFQPRSCSYASMTMTGRIPTFS